jgi:hypothetical protein
MVGLYSFTVHVAITHIKNQLMHNQNYTFFKTQFSKTLECLCPVSPYMFRSLKADHPQGRMFLCTATFCLVVVPRHNCTGSSGRAHTTAQTETKPHARVKLCRGTTTRQTSSSAKGTFAPEDGQLLVTETCRVTRDTNILMF